MFEPPFPRQRLHDALRRLFDRRLATGRVDGLLFGGISLHRYLEDETQVVADIWAALEQGRLSLGPARAVSRRVGGKTRTLYDFDIYSTIVIAALAEEMSTRLEPTLAGNLFSYRRALGSVQAAQAAARALRRVTSPGSGAAGLFVLRRDVKGYFDRIDVSPTSSFWPRLARRLGPWLDQHRALLEQAVRPLVERDDGPPTPLLRGVATGSPIANVVGNAYLADLDDELSEVATVAVRYGDDLLVGATSLVELEQLDAIIARHLTESGLEAHPDKDRRVYLSTAGHPRDGVEGDHRVELLGFALSARGEVGLPVRKVRAMMRDLDRRASRSAAALGTDDVDERAALAVAVVADALRPRSMTAHPLAVPLRRVVTDRQQLTDLDHRLAALVVKVATGARGPRGFRRLPPRQLRALGLPSLVDGRNRQGRPR